MTVHPVPGNHITTCSREVNDRLVMAWIVYGWETRSRDVWKPVSNRTLGIISNICKFRGGTLALLGPVGTPQDFTWPDLGKMTPAR